MYYYSLRCFESATCHILFCDKFGKLDNNNRITLIRGLAGQRAVLPNEKRELLAGCTEDIRAGCIKRQTGGLQTRAAFQPVLFCNPA